MKLHLRCAKIRSPNKPQHTVCTVCTVCTYCVYCMDILCVLYVRTVCTVWTYCVYCVNVLCVLYPLCTTYISHYVCGAQIRAVILALIKEKHADKIVGCRGST